MPWWTLRQLRYPGGADPAPRPDFDDLGVHEASVAPQTSDLASISPSSAGPLVTSIFIRFNRSGPCREIPNARRLRLSSLWTRGREDVALLDSAGSASVAGGIGTAHELGGNISGELLRRRAGRRAQTFFSSRTFPARVGEQDLRRGPAFPEVLLELAVEDSKEVLGEAGRRSTLAGRWIDITLDGSRGLAEGLIRRLVEALLVAATIRMSTAMSCTPTRLALLVDEPEQWPGGSGMSPTSSRTGCPGDRLDQAPWSPGRRWAHSCPKTRSQQTPGSSSSSPPGGWRHLAAVVDGPRDSSFPSRLARDEDSRSLRCETLSTSGHLLRRGRRPTIWSAWWRRARRRKPASWMSRSGSAPSSHGEQELGELRGFLGNVRRLHRLHGR
jgi:hypothetical protein